MANYGRGWGDGYGAQSAEAIDNYQEQKEIETGRIQNARAQRERAMAVNAKSPRSALEAIRDGYGPNHLSKFARDVAANALAVMEGSKDD
tara:strand:- start:826 stop:1095 length:270 start_codon:yes stop_codon:yes gene_type:complete